MVRGPTLVAIVAAGLAPAPGSAQTVQYRSPAGVEYRSQADTGPIARAQAALSADPKNVDRFIQLGVAQSGARQFREAIQTFTRAMAVEPNNAMLYRWRGHRYLSVRELDKAQADLTKGLKLDSTNYGILYHLGIVRFTRGDFPGGFPGDKRNAFTREGRSREEQDALARDVHADALVLGLHPGEQHGARLLADVSLRAERPRHAMAGTQREPRWNSTTSKVCSRISRSNARPWFLT